MFRTHILTLCLMAGLGAAPGLAFAQDQADPSAQAKVHIGPLALSPFVSLTNLGFDNNVFNEPSDLSPKSDFTFTLQGKTDLWLHLRRSLVTASVTDDVVYYRTYSKQRSVNGFYKLGLLVPLNRIVFKANSGYVNTTDRPGYEIDARLPRTEALADGAIELRASAKTFAGVRAARQRISYGTADAFAGANIRTELSRTVTSEALTLRHRLTPLTTLVLDVGKQQDRFEFNPLRDSDSTTVVVGALFDQFALLKGSARFGYRAFTPLVAGLPDYKGSTAAVDLTYVARGATRVTVVGARDINYSYDVNQPYYLQTGATLSVSQQVYHSVDVVGRAGLQRLNYRDRTGIAIAAAGRTDAVHTYQAGIGYRLGRNLRAGINLDKQHRTSSLLARTYDNVRFGMAVTYEF